MEIDFSGHVVLVTGAATGLGRAIAEAFGQAGAIVALNDRSPDRAVSTASKLRSAGIACESFAADVRDAEAVRQMVREVSAGLGAPDIVVANAGIYPNTAFLDLSLEEWDAVLDTNLSGVFVTCQAAAQAMIAAGKRGQLITIASGAAVTAIRGWAHYCTSKAAVVMLTRAMALELGEHGIRANAVLPGYIDVPEGGAHLDEAYKTAARTANPLGRAGEPQDIANAILLLASPLATHINGVSLPVDAGSSAGRIGIWPA